LMSQTDTALRKIMKQYYRFFVKLGQYKMSRESVIQAFFQVARRYYYGK